MSKLEKILNNVHLKKRIIAGVGAFVLGLSSCGGNTSINLNFHDKRPDAGVEDVVDYSDLKKEVPNQEQDSSVATYDPDTGEEASSQEQEGMDAAVYPDRGEHGTTPDTLNLHYRCGNLSSYPLTFQTDGLFNGYAVVGVAAPVTDNLAMTDIIANMMYHDEEGDLTRIQVGDAARLDTEIADPQAQNLIIVGNPCHNSIAAQILGKNYAPGDQQCYGNNGINPGTAKIIMLESIDTSKLALIVAGYSEADTRSAARIIAYRPDELTGCEVTVVGTTLTGR